MLVKAYRPSLACLAAWGCLSMAKEQGSQKEVEIWLLCALYVAEVGQIEIQCIAEVKNSNPKVPVALMR
jgi:1,4-dihydroxy-2-naphthoyl-CoA synthase